MLDEPTNISPELLVNSLADIIRKRRRNELSVLKAENALLRYYRTKSLMPQRHIVRTLVAYDDDKPRTMADALRLVVNGEPVDSYQILAEVKKRFPHIRTCLKTTRLTLCTLTKTGVLKVKRNGLHRGLYTKEE